MQDYKVSKQTALWVEAQKTLNEFAKAYSDAMTEQYGADTDRDFDEAFMPLFRPMQELIEAKIGASVVDRLAYTENKGQVL